MSVRRRGVTGLRTSFDVAVKQLADELAGNTSLPYSDIIQEMLQRQQETLISASEQMREMLANAYDTTILSWSYLLDMKDKETEGHSGRVTDLMMRLTRSIGMNEEEVLYARWGALLHDVGKMGVPDAILHKPRALTNEEWVYHAPAYDDCLRSAPRPSPFSAPALDIPYCHMKSGMERDTRAVSKGNRYRSPPVSSR